VILSVEPQKAQQIKILILIRHLKTAASFGVFCYPFSGPSNNYKFKSTHPLSPVLMSHDPHYYGTVRTNLIHSTAKFTIINDIHS
jgi:hypothetical protein